MVSLENPVHPQEVESLATPPDFRASQCLRVLSEKNMVYGCGSCWVIGTHGAPVTFQGASILVGSHQPRRPIKPVQHEQRPESMADCGAQIRSQLAETNSDHLSLGDDLPPLQKELRTYPC